MSSIGTYNYNLAKYLCSLLKPHISSEFFATDTFSFVQEIQQFDFSDKFLVSYDVTSLFTNIPLRSETIDLAVKAIIDGNMNPDLKLSKFHLKQLFNFATSHTHFLFNGCFYDQTRCFREAYTGLPVVRVTENQKALNCVVLNYSIPVSEE